MLAFAAMSLFSLQDALIKFLTGEYSLFQVLFIRSIVVSVPLFVLLVVRFGRKGFVTRRPLDHGIRVTLNFVAFVSYYFAVTRLPLSDATAIALSAPLIMTALSGPMLGEPADIKRKIVLLAGFTGVLIVIQPTSTGLDWLGVGAALVGATGFAALALQTRRMSATEETELMVFYAAFAFVLVTGAIMIFQWETPDAQSIMVMIGTGIVTLFAQSCIVHSYRYAPVYVIAPFEYVTILWAIFLGWWWFAEPPTSTMLSGAVIIILSGLAIVYLERKSLPRALAEHR